MYRLNSDCWVWSLRPPLCLLSHNSRSHASAMLSHREEEVEDEVAGEHTVWCCTTGCDDFIGQAANAQWSTCEPPVYSKIPSSSGTSEHNPCAPSSQQSIRVTEADVLPHYVDGHGWEGPALETQECVCAYNQREPEGLGPCWSGTPFIYHGVRSNMVVGVEVVEEVAVEDTLEVITEDIYTDDLLDPEALQDDQMYPT